MTFAAAVIIAVAFWAPRGVHPVPGCNIRPAVVADSALPMGSNGTTALAATYEPNADGTPTPLCGLIMESHALRRYQALNPAYYCTIITHEVKHAMGYGHTPDGVMRADPIAPTDRDVFPWPCRAAAKEQQNAHR